MRTFVSALLLTSFLIITITLPASFFFASALLLKLTLIFVGVAILAFWATFLVYLFEAIGGYHD